MSHDALAPDGGDRGRLRFPSGRQRRSEIVLVSILAKTDRVTAFELSGCLDDHALHGFSPKTSLDRICSQVV
jgi:hypothetical protein